MAAPDSARLARRIVRKKARLVSHLPPLDPLAGLDLEDETLQMFVAVDVDLATFMTEDGTRAKLEAEGIRETADFTIYVPSIRRLYVLSNDGEAVAVVDGDALAGETAWSAMYRQGKLVAHLAEPQQWDDSGLL